MPLSCVEALRARRRELAEARLRVGPLWQETDLVFERATGDILRPNVVRNRFYELTEALRLPRIRFHDLRHAAATLMLQNGVHLRVVQKRLGHSDVSITMNRYSHVTQTLQRQAADEMDKHLGIEKTPLLMALDCNPFAIWKSGMKKAPVYGAFDVRRGDGGIL